MFKHHLHHRLFPSLSYMFPCFSSLHLFLQYSLPIFLSLQRTLDVNECQRASIRGLHMIFFPAGSCSLCFLTFLEKCGALLGIFNTSKIISPWDIPRNSIQLSSRLVGFPTFHMFHSFSCNCFEISGRVVWFWQLLTLVFEECR